MAGCEQDGPPPGDSPGPTPEDLWPAYYEELHALAASIMRGEPRSPSLQPTLVLHEAFMRVFKDGVPEWRGKAYFLGSMARAMRQYLVDRGRRRRLERRAAGDGQLRDVAELSLGKVGRCPEVAAELNAAIDDLARVAPRAATVVEFRCAYDLPLEDIASILGISDRTARADWTFARTWLYERLGRINPAG
jgi:RNA polymerase sigma factor (TIGR02999 family)